MKNGKWRKPNQIFAWFQWESPWFRGPNKDDMRHYDDFFNASISYRSDSTFFLPYGTINSLIKNNKTEIGRSFEIMREMSDDEATEYNLNPENHKNPITGTNKYGATAIVSNCDAPYRNEIIKSLADLLEFPDGKKALNAFGKCAPLYGMEPGWFGQKPKRDQAVVDKHTAI